MGRKFVFGCFSFYFFFSQKQLPQKIVGLHQTKNQFKALSAELNYLQKFQKVLLVYRKTRSKLCPINPSSSD